MTATPAVLILAALSFLTSASQAREAVRCEPLSAAEWATRCVADRASVEDLADEVRRFPGLSGLDSFSELRELLLTGQLGGDCRKALRQLLAAALNLASGRLSGDCCVEHADGGSRSLREALHLHAENCSHGRDCGDALRFLQRINDASRVRDCGSSDDGSSDDGSSDDGSSDDGSSDDGSSDDGSSDDGSSDDGSSDDDSSDDGSSDDGSSAHGGHDDGDESRCCKPRSRGWWHRQCLGAGRVEPTRGNSQAKGPGAHPHLSEQDRDQAIRRARHRLGGAGLGPCAALDSKNLGGSQGKAEAEVAALALNWGAGLLEGCGRAEPLLERSIRALKEENWREAWELAHDGNHARGLRRCEGDHDDESSDDGQRESDHEEGDADADSKKESGSENQGKAKGKDKDKDKDKDKKK